MTDTPVTNRTAQGRFPKGVSGNPHGRPKSESAVLRQSLADGAADVVKVVLEAAKAGDMQAAKMVLDRLVPPLKSASPPVTISMPANPTIHDTALAILMETIAGHLAPETAATLIAAAGNLSRITELEELRIRLESIERAIKTRNNSK
jgi:hypothetical protein